MPSVRSGPSFVSVFSVVRFSGFFGPGPGPSVSPFLRFSASGCCVRPFGSCLRFSVSPFVRLSVCPLGGSGSGFGLVGEKFRLSPRHKTVLSVPGLSVCLLRPCPRPRPRPRPLETSRGRPKRCWWPVPRRALRLRLRLRLLLLLLRWCPLLPRCVVRVIFPFRFLRGRRSLVPVLRCRCCWLLTTRVPRSRMRSTASCRLEVPVLRRRRVCCSSVRLLRLRWRRRRRVCRFWVPRLLLLLLRRPRRFRCPTFRWVLRFLPVFFRRWPPPTRSVWRRSAVVARVVMPSVVRCCFLLRVSPLPWVSGSCTSCV